MRVCPKCNIEYEEGKKFCRKCGSFLLTEEGSTFEFPIVESTESEKTEGSLFCGTCQEFYPKGKYCRKCGSLLVQETPPQEPDAHLFEKKPVRRLAKEWLKSPHPLHLISASVVILLIMIGGYFLWQRSFQTSKPIQPPLQDPPSLIEPKEAEKIHPSSKRSNKQISKRISISSCPVILLVSKTGKERRGRHSKIGQISPLSISPTI